MSVPIKSENRSRYPADWPQVRERILKRAGYRCEHPGCTAAQYDFGRWLMDDRPPRWLRNPHVQSVLSSMPLRRAAAPLVVRADDAPQALQLLASAVVAAVASAGVTSAERSQ